MNIIKYKIFYVRALFKSNQVINANNVINIYRQNFNIALNLSKNEISKEKTKALGNYKNIELLELCQKISNKDIKVNVNAIDIFFDYENKNKKIKEKRKEKVIFMTIDKMEEDLKNS